MDVKDAIGTEQNVTL